MTEKILDNTYKLLEEIGRGGFGAVYRAVRVGAEGSGAVAIKLLNRNPSMSHQDYARFQREATFMSQLVHPGIVSVYELGEEVGCYFIVMEFIAGKNLREFVKQKGGRLPINDVFDILVQAAEALEYVHTHNIVHRDIKPQNILVCEIKDRGEPRNQVKLVDFGVARLSHSNASVDENVRSGEVVGTHAYMAPEATGLVEWELDHRADIYSLGTVAFELLAGRTPFHDLKGQEQMRAHVEKTPPPIASIKGFDVPDVVERLISKCISKKPEDRYQSMFALLCDLKRIQSDLKTHGVVEEFELGTKDFGIGKLLSTVFVARDDFVDEIIRFITKDTKRARMSWALVKGEVGFGKSKILSELRQHLEATEVNFLYLKFSESEQRLPFQALTLAINDYLANIEKNQSRLFNEFINGIIAKIGDSAKELAHLIPALRSRLTHHVSQTASDFPQSQFFLNPVVPMVLKNATSEDMAIDWRYAAPNSRVNQSFIDLLGGLSGENGNLVFLLDDLHLADSSTLALFQFMIEQVTQPVNFSFVLTMRESIGRNNLVLESFVRRLSSLKRRFQAWDLPLFDRGAVIEYLNEIGMRDPSEEFVQFLVEKIAGSPMQLASIVKQMLAQNVLVPAKSSSSKKSVAGFSVDWDRLTSMPIDAVNIEILIASIDTMDKRDLQLLRIVAVAHEACEFEYLRIDPDFSRLELETRLSTLVKRGIFEILGDDSIPINRKSFFFTHEKLRNAVLRNMDSEMQRLLHYQLAQRIQALYKSPRREQILALARHYDGAGDKAEADTATLAFIRGIRIYVSTFQYNLANYYVDKVLERLKEIPFKTERRNRLRDVLDAKYTIYAAQGNLVAASDVCKELIDITSNPLKRAALQTFWSQLLLSLGRHSHAYDEAQKVIDQFKFTATSRISKLLMKLNLFIFCMPIHRYLFNVIQKFWKRPTTEEAALSLHAAVLMNMAQLHGSEKNLEESLFAAVRVDVAGASKGRWTCVYDALSAALLMRAGKVLVAYKHIEDAERSLAASGTSDALRWVTLIRALWLDYPMGRIDKLLTMFDESRQSSLPTSGLLHFETYGLKAWLRLIAPSSLKKQDKLDTGDRRRRRSDREPRVNALDRMDGSKGDILVESNNARRVLDAGENGQYTSLALFSDSLRFALSDRIEPLKRATEQYKRQSTTSHIGTVFACYSFALHALVSGRHKRALEWYLRGTKVLRYSKPDVLALPISDALRAAILLLPLLAVSMEAKGWPWDKKLRKLLKNVNLLLENAEGKNNPRRNAIAKLYNAVLEFTGGSRKKAFIELEDAIKEARNQKIELIECLALSFMGSFSAQCKHPRAEENFDQAYRLARTHNWKLLERQIQGMAKLNSIVLPEIVTKESSKTDTQTKMRPTIAAVSPVMIGLQSLHEKDNLDELLGATSQLITSILGAQRSYVFLAEGDTVKKRFICRAKFMLAPDVIERISEIDILKSLSYELRDPVRVLQMELPPEGNNALQFKRSENTRSKAVRKSEFSHGNFDSTAAVTIPLSEEERTIAISVQDSEKTKAFVVEEATGVIQLPSKSKTPGYLVQIALSFNQHLYGWVAVPQVNSLKYAAVEQDLVLFGLHVGHMLSRILAGPEKVEVQGSSTLKTTRRLSQLVDGELPRDVLVEIMGDIPSTKQTYWKIFRLRSRRSLVVHWHVKSKNPLQELKLRELMERHVIFLVRSVRQASDPGTMDAFVNKLYSDFTTIFETASKEGTFEVLDFNFLVWDSKDRRAFEGTFGTEYFSFSGQSVVENEFLQELSGILTQDRFVYRERSRQLTGTGGWLFAGSSRTKDVLHRFSTHDFAENYINQRSSGGSHLAKSLSFENDDHPPGLAFFAIHES